MLQDEVRKWRRQGVVQEADQRLIKAAVLFANGNIDKPGYELLRDKAGAELDAATEVLSRLQVVELGIALPPLVVMPAVNFPCRLRRGALSWPHTQALSSGQHPFRTIVSFDVGRHAGPQKRSAATARA
jgi:hypothetical protein